MSNRSTKTSRYVVTIYSFNHNTGVYSDVPVLHVFRLKVKAMAFYLNTVKIVKDRVYFYDIRNKPNFIRSFREHPPIKYHD